MHDLLDRQKALVSNVSPAQALGARQAYIYIYILILILILIGNKGRKQALTMGDYFLPPPVLQCRGAALVKANTANHSPREHQTIHRITTLLARHFMES